MATVTLFDSTRMQAIEDGTVTTGDVDAGSGHLILTHHDGSTHDAGKVTADNLADASETVEGIAKLATAAQAVAGTDDSTIVTPLKLEDVFVDKQTNVAYEALTTRRGLVQLATSAEVEAGTDTNKAITSKGFADGFATAFPPAYSSAQSPLAARVTTLETELGLIPIAPDSVTFVNGTGVTGSASIGSTGLVTFANCASINFLGLFKLTRGKRYKVFINIAQYSDPSPYIYLRLAKLGVWDANTFMNGGTSYRQNSTNGIFLAVSAQNYAPIGYGGTHGNFVELDFQYPIQNSTLNTPIIITRAGYSDTSHTSIWGSYNWSGAGQYDGFGFYVGGGASNGFGGEMRAYVYTD